MRPIGIRQSALRNPLNLALGTEAHVRVIRVLIEKEHPVTTSHLAQTAGLSVAGARRALETLVNAGFVEPVGFSKAQFQLRTAHPLTHSLRALFRAEAERFDALLAGIKESVRDIESLLMSVWIEEAPAEGDADDENVRLHFLARGPDLVRLRDLLRSRLGRIEKQLDVAIEIVSLTQADLEANPPRASDGSKSLIFGLPPTALAPRNRPPGDIRRSRTHEETDQEQLALGKELSILLREDPSLIPRTASRLRKLLESEPRPSSDLREWLHILENNSPRLIARLLKNDNESARRLRQSQVFLPVLSPDQRARLLAAKNKAKES